MPSVNVNDPDPNTSVSRLFVAKGTATAAPTVRIETGAGVLIANGNVTFANGDWTASFALGMDFTGCRIVAEVGGVNFSVTNITVSTPAPTGGND